MTIDMTSLQELERRRDKVKQYVHKAEVTLLIVNSLTSVQAFKDLNNSEWKDAQMFTLETWDMLSPEELNGLTKYYIVHVRGDGPPVPTALQFLVRRMFVEKSGKFIVMRDKTGLSGAAL